MTSERIQRVNHLIRQELSQIILREFDFSPDIFVTLTRVETSNNLIEAKIYISVIPKNEIKMVFKLLNQRIYKLQQKLNQRLKMRPVPRIVFLEEREIL